MATIVKLSDVIVQGATYRLDLDRVTYPYDVVEDAAGNLVRHDGTPAFDGDRVAEAYVGCTARMQIRETLDAPGVIAELTTENGGIVLGGMRLSLFISDASTSAMAGWERAIGHIEVIRASGDVERQYEITYTLDREATR